MPQPPTTLGSVANTLGRRRVLLLAWLAASAVLTVVFLRFPEGLPGSGWYLAVAGGASAAAWVGAAVLRGRDRMVGLLLAAAITLSAAADLTFFVIEWQTGIGPDASVADPGWVASYGLLIAALLLLLRRGDHSQRRDIEGLIDVGAVVVAGMLIVWQLAVAATLADQTVGLEIRLLFGLYPVLDLAVLALALRVLVRDRTVGALLVTVGVGLWLAADTAYLAVADPAAYSVALDGVWLWAMILMALAVVQGPSTPLGRRAGRPRPAREDAALGRTLMALLPLLVPGVIELLGALRGVEVNSVVTLAATVILVALAFVRMARLAQSTRRARQALVSQERYARALAANASDAVVVTDADLRVKEESPRLAALSGKPAGELPGMSLLSVVLPEDREAARATLRRCLERPRRVYYAELRIGDDLRQHRWVAARVVNLLADPDVRGIVLNLHDISDKKRVEAALSHQAFHDALTGLANRALFRDRLDHALERDADRGTSAAVIFLDLDGFKSVNDDLGHDQGDNLLREVALRLSSAVRPGDTVARIGGDEFAILIEDGTIEDGQPVDDEASETAERVLRVLQEPAQLGEHTVTVSASLGVAAGNRSTGSAKLLHAADVAMYQSKATGKGRWTRHRPGTRTGSQERTELSGRLDAALHRDELRLVYQPVVELSTDRLVGFEALVRWEHERYGTLEPERFIPLAEETGLIVPIGRWVLQEAAKWAARWRHRLEPGRHLSMAINLSPRQLAAPDLVNDVAQALTNTGLDPNDLILEITESTLTDDHGAATRLQQLHDLGVRLAIDDFGTGHASRSHLRESPVDMLKIDRSFVHAIPAQGEFPADVRGLLELGHTLQFSTLAEGVERSFQRTRLRDERCDLAQGYLFARPMPPDEAERLLA